MQNKVDTEATSLTTNAKMADFRIADANIVCQFMILIDRNSRPMRGEVTFDD